MDKKWKKKAVALTLITSVAVSSPLYLTGCDDSEVVVTGKASEKDNAYHGIGSTPFVFPDDVRGREKLSKEELIVNPYFRSVGWAMYLNSKNQDSKSGGSSTFIKAKGNSGNSSSGARSSSSS